MKQKDKRIKNPAASLKNLQENDFVFEIDFYEGIIEKKPNFVEALMALGDLYTKVGQHEKGLAIDEKLSKLRPYNPIVLYNLACSYSILNDSKKAFRTIQKAIECGYRDFEHLEHDPDLINLRQDNRFQHYLAKIKKNRNISK